MGGGCVCKRCKMSGSRLGDSLFLFLRAGRLMWNKLKRKFLHCDRVRTNNPASSAPFQPRPHFFQVHNRDWACNSVYTFRPGHNRKKLLPKLTIFIFVTGSEKETPQLMQIYRRSLSGIKNRPNMEISQHPTITVRLYPTILNG